MGCSATLEARKRKNKLIQQDNRIKMDLINERRESNKVWNVLLLGPAGSGKSTIMKSFPLTEQERLQYISCIHKQCITDMQLAFHQSILPKLLVFGYIQELEYKYSNETTPPMVPYEIQMHILYYYNEIPNISERGMMAADSIQFLQRA